MNRFYAFWDRGLQALWGAAISRDLKRWGMLAIAWATFFAFGGVAVAGGKADLKPGDVLLGQNLKETPWVLLYGGVRHAAIWDGSQVIEAGVHSGIEKFWPRGYTQTVSYEQFVRRYNNVYVYRSNWGPPGQSIANGARAIHKDSKVGVLSCVELIELSRYLASGKLVRYYTPSGIANSKDWYFVTIAR